MTKVKRKMNATSEEQEEVHNNSRITLSNTSNIIAIPETLEENYE